MANVAERLDQAIRAAGVPIVGVSVGDEQQKATWTVQPADQQAAAQPVINAFVMPSAAVFLDESAQRYVTDKAVIAIASALWECIPAPTMTKAQALARAKAIYKTLSP